MPAFLSQWCNDWLGQGLKNRLPGASIFSCQASVDQASVDRQITFWDENSPNIYVHLRYEQAN